MKRWMFGLLFGGMGLAGGVLTLLSAADEAGWLHAKAASKEAPAPKILPYDASHPPKLVAEQTDYDFGVMEIGETASHEFTVRNEGQGDLNLELVGTSCKCTLADLPDGRIPPGEERTVRMEWETQNEYAEFRHGAILRTNDPDQPELNLVITGSVRRSLVREPSDLVIIGRTQPNERASHGVWFYSQTYPALEVAKVELLHPHLSWEVEPARESDMQRWHATSALKLKLTLEPGQPEGRLNGSLRVHLRVPGLPDDRQPAVEVVDVYTQVLKSVRYFGPQYEPGHVLNMEHVTQGEAVSSTVFLAIRGQAAKIKVLESHITPDFLQVELLHDETLENGWTRHKIVVTVPDNAPLANHLSTDLGEIRLVTDHPDVPEIRFRVALAVVPPAPPPALGP